MFSIRRWWDRHGVQGVLITLAVGAAWFLRQTQGTAMMEVYYWLSRPFHASPVQEELLTNARILELQSRIVELEQQSQAFRSLERYAASLKDKGVDAPVIGRSADHWWQQVTIGRGSRAGIRVGDVVMGTGGLVGRITSVSPHTSRVMLLSDGSSRVGVTVSRSRQMGFMRGQGEMRAVIEFFDKVPDVKPGDVISTSAFSHLFPGNLPIGRIESVDLNQSPAPEATVLLMAPIDSLEWVVVYSNPRLSEATNPAPASATP